MVRLSSPVREVEAILLPFAEANDQPPNRFGSGKERGGGGRDKRARYRLYNGYGDIGCQASCLIFPTPGCWEITAQVGEREDSRITFVTKVEKIGEGPAWRRDPPG